MHILDKEGEDATMSAQKRFLGITAMTPFVQTEGIEAVIFNVAERAGASAIATNTSVTAASHEGIGSFQPPDDAGASVRLFDRPIFGKNALWLRSGPGHTANPAHFADSEYKPRRPNDLTESDGPIVGEYIRAAKDAGLKVYIQTGATDPPGLRDEDKPWLPNGRLPTGRMANTGSLACPAIRRYIRSWTNDIFSVYPEVDGIRPDWPEYPCYTIGELFQDFSPHVAAWATEHGFDYQRIHEQVGEFYDYLHGSLTNRDVAEFASPDRGIFAIQRLYNRFPGIAEWFRLKAALSTDLLREWREAIQDAGGDGKELAANAFMPPYSYFTGLDFAMVSAYCHSVAPKLYTMHWSLMVKFWSDELLIHNTGLNPNLLARALVNIMDIKDCVEDGTPITLTRYGYPQPDEPHPVPNGPQQRKIEQVLTAVNGESQVYALVHGYGPVEDFRRRLQLVADSDADGCWINRYGYLSDEKLDVVREIWH